MTRSDAFWDGHKKLYPDQKNHYVPERATVKTTPQEQKTALWEAWYKVQAKPEAEMGLWSQHTMVHKALKQAGLGEWPVERGMKALNLDHETSEAPSMLHDPIG